MPAFKRKRYKDLYTRSQAALQEVREERGFLMRELDRLRDILATHAENETIPEINDFLSTYPLAEAIPLFPLSYEAVRAHIQSTAGSMAPREMHLEQISWCGKKVVCRP